MEAGEPVITFTTEWRNGKRLNHFLEGTFLHYSEHRGIVSINIPSSFTDNFCENNVGRYEIIEHEDVHTDTGMYEKRTRMRKSKE